MFEKWDVFLQENKDKVLVTGGISANKVLEIESDLGLCLCNSYKEYLRKYGFIMGYGLEINGCGLNGESQLVQDTVRFRQYSLPHNLLVMSDLGEYVYCLDNENEEVFCWYRDDCSSESEGCNLETFILDRLEDGKDNMV